MQSASRIKAHSEDLLRARGVPTNEHLPLIEQEQELVVASPAAVRSRCLILATVCARAYGAPYDLVQGHVEHNGLGPFCSPTEFALINTRAPSPEQLTPFLVAPEALWELLWVLEVVPTIDHWRPCSDQLVHMVPKPGEALSTFLPHPRIRDTESLLCEADFLYRLHWAVRDAALNQRASPNRQPELLTLQRLHAINWTLRSDTDWDDVDTST